MDLPQGYAARGTVALEEALRHVRPSIAMASLQSRNSSPQHGRLRCTVSAIDCEPDSFLICEWEKDEKRFDRFLICERKLEDTIGHRSKRRMINLKDE
jgi:hypothetical protein